MDPAEIIRAVLASAATVTASVWLYRAITGGLRPHPTVGGGWKVVGDAATGTRWSTRAALLLAGGTAVAPPGAAQLILLWVTVIAGVAALVYHGARQAQVVRREGVTPAQVSALWVAAGLVTAGFVWWTMLMSKDDRLTNTGPQRDTAAATQAVMDAQSALMRNAVVAAVVVLVAFLFLARRGYRKKTFQLTRRTSTRRPGQATTAARRGGRRSVRDQHPSHSPGAQSRARFSRHR